MCPVQAMVSKAEYDELEGKYNTLRHEFDQLKKMIFSAKSERFVGTQVAPEKWPSGISRLKPTERPPSPRR